MKHNLRNGAVPVCSAGHHTATAAFPASQSLDEPADRSTRLYSNRTGSRSAITPLCTIACGRIAKLEALTYANFLCNEDGFDPISFGATVGAVMELCEMQVLTSKEIGIAASPQFPFWLAYTTNMPGSNFRKRQAVSAALSLPDKVLSTGMPVPSK